MLLVSVPGFSQTRSCDLFFAETKPRESARADAQRAFEETTIDVAESLTSEGKKFFEENLPYVYKRPDLLEIKTHAFENYDAQYIKFYEAMTHFEVLKDKVADIYESAKTQNLKPRDIDNKLKLFQEQTKDQIQGIIARTSQFFEAVGIHHDLIWVGDRRTFAIRIATTGDLIFNRMAHDLKLGKKGKSRQQERVYDLDVVIDVHKLFILISEGLFSRKTQNHARRLTFDPSIVLLDSITQNPTALHELMHALNDLLKEQGKVEAHDAEIVIYKLPESTLKNLNGYTDAFSVNEISSFRLSIRGMAHQAITSKNPEEINYIYRNIMNEVQQEIGFSKVTSMAFKQLKQSPPKAGKFESIEVKTDEFWLTVSHNEKLDYNKTIEMSDFTYNMYNAIGAKLIGSQNKSTEEKVLALKKMVKVLSIPSVRKLRGNYPSSTEIYQKLQ